MNPENPKFAATLSELLDQLQIPWNAYDLLMIGDGAGQGWDKPAGWGVAVLDQQGNRGLLAGGVSSGTVSWAEVAPYLHALRHDFFERQHEKLSAVRRVIIVSDSQVSVRIGNGEFVPRTNQDLWESFNFYTSRGYQIRWIWTDRNRNSLHVLVDQLSKGGELFREMCQGTDVYDLLPA